MLGSYVSVRLHSRNWAADLPTLTYMFYFYTPKDLSKIACLAHASVFAAPRRIRGGATRRRDSKVRVFRRKWMPFGKNASSS
jgi:hypothetical protein